MPFKFEKGKNPYTSTYFGILQVGPNTGHPQIIAKERDLSQKIVAGHKIKSAANVELDEHAVKEAAAKLRDPRSAAEELLLMHAQPQAEDQSKIKGMIEQLRKKASLTNEHAPIPLRSALEIFWFLPAPGHDAVPLPEWAEFELTSPNDPDDLALDVVFDI